MKSPKTYFITGIIVLLPSIVTFYTLYKLFIFIDGFLGKPIRTYTGYNIPGVGLFLTVLLIWFIGVLATNIIGRKILHMLEFLFTNIPLVRGIYKTVKQIVDAFSHQNSNAFQRVVMIEYPRKGLYALAFQTGVAKGELQAKTRQEVINVFLPTTPNPTSGFLLLVPREDVVFLDMSVEEGLKLIISGGVVTPSCEDTVVSPGEKL